MRIDAETLEERLAALLSGATTVMIDHYELSRYDRGVIVLALRRSAAHYQQEQDLPKSPVNG